MLQRRREESINQYDLPGNVAISPLEGTIVNADGVDVFVHRSGSGPPVILAHGIPTSSTVYRNIIPHLAKDFEVIAFDWPGFGGSAKPHDFPYTYGRYERLFSALLAKLGIKKIHGLVVHDLSGPILLDWLSRSPDRVGRLAILNTTLYPRHWHPPKLALAQTIPLVGPLLMKISGRQYLRNLLQRISPGMSEEAVEYYLEATADPDAKRALSRLYGRMGRSVKDIKGVRHRIKHEWKGPTHIIWGRKDPILDEGNVKAFSRDIPQATHDVLDAGHFVQEERPEAVAPALSRFFQE